MYKNQQTIVHLLSHSEKAGAEAVAIRLLLASSRAFKVFLASVPGGGLERFSDQHSIPFIPLNSSNIFKVFRLCLSHNVSYLHAHDFRASIAAAPLAIFGVSIISHIHQNPPFAKHVNLYSIAYFLSCYFYSKIIVVSEAILSESWPLKFFKSKCQVLHNCVDLAKISSLSLCAAPESISGRYDIAFLGRLSNEKDPLRALCIFESLLVLRPDSRMIFIGAGPLFDVCKSIVLSRKLNAKVTFTGYLANPYNVLRLCKIVLITSVYEGFSLACLEAMALGLPVVAHSVGGLVEILNFHPDILFQSDEVALKSIHKLLTNSQIYDHVSRLSLRRSKDFSCLHQPPHQIYS